MPLESRDRKCFVRTACTQATRTKPGSGLRPDTPASVSEFKLSFSYVEKQSASGYRQV